MSVSLRRQDGFSIVELLLVLMVMAVILTISLPRIASVRSGLAVRGAVNEFVAAHNLARSIAIRSSRTAQLKIDTDAATFWVQVDTSLAGTSAMDTIGTPVSLSELRVTVSSTRSVLCFDAQGMVRSGGACDATQSGLVVFSADSKSDTLRRSEMGVLVR